MQTKTYCQTPDCDREARYGISYSWGERFNLCGPCYTSHDTGGNIARAQGKHYSDSLMTTILEARR